MQQVQVLSANYATADDAVEMIVRLPDADIVDLVKGRHQTEGEDDDVMSSSGSVSDSTIGAAFF